jgi:hypothetical protein
MAAARPIPRVAPVRITVGIGTKATRGPLPAARQCAEPELAHPDFVWHTTTFLALADVGDQVVTVLNHRRGGSATTATAAE